MIDLLPSKHFCLVFFGLSLSCTVGIPSWFEISDAKSGIVTSGLNIYKSLGHAVNPQLDTRKNFLQTRSFPFQAKETKKNINDEICFFLSLSSAITSFCISRSKLKFKAMMIGLR